MSSSKPPFLALILALYASDHFLLLHGQEPAYPPESLPGQEPPSWSAPSPPAPPPDTPSSPSSSSITEPPGNDTASTSAPPPPPSDIPSSSSPSSITEPKIEPSYNSTGRTIELAVPCAVVVVVLVVLGAGFFTWRWNRKKRGTQQSGSDNAVSTRPLPTNADQPKPRQRLHTQGGAALPPGPSLPSASPGVLSNQQPSPHNVASPLMYSTHGTKVRI